MTACPLISKTLGGVLHGFFTRGGGVSTGIYGSLNCGPGSDDDPAHVVENRARALNPLSETADLIGLHQIHSNIVHIIDAPLRLEGDGFVTNRPGLALSILTADCAPLLFADPQAGVIGAAHAGWKGAATGIIENTVQKMCDLGAERSRITAAIGPCIAQPSYEVGPEFYDKINDSRFFTPSNKNGHHQFDLPGYILAQLHKSGLTKIDHIARDTYCQEQDFFSYRRTTHRGENDYGRQISIILL